MPQFHPNRAKINKVIETLLLLFFLCMSILDIFLCLLTIAFPRGPTTINIVIPKQYFNSLLKVASILIHCYAITMAVTNVAILGGSIMVYLIYCSLFLTRELRVGRARYRTSDCLRQPENIILVYRSFQVLHENCMCFLGIFLVCCNAIFMMSAISINFVLLRYWQVMHVTSKAPLSLGTVLLMGFWSILLELGKTFFVRGTKVILSWKRHTVWNSNPRRNKEMRKFAKSCKPILVSYGRQFVVGRVSVINFFRGVVRGTQRALLTTSRKF